MERMLARRSVVLIVVVSWLVAAPARADDAQDILGVWVPVGLESGGNALTPAQVASIASQITMTVTQEKISIPGDGATEISYELGSEANPKSIDTVDLNGAQKGERRKGIYYLRGDTLKLCMAPKDGTRPKIFSSKPGEEGCGERVITFQRKK
jgi:uncharacterized protein (TIGR03067 family)